MKITLVCHDIPYPPIHGARVDTWRRIKAFSQFGVELQIICWHSKTPKAEEISEIEKYVKKINLIPFKKTLGSSVKRIIDLWHYPLEVTSRIVRGEELSNLLSDVSTFNPDVIWLDHVHGGEVAFELTKNLHLPLITRAHNIEHLYYRRLLALTTDLKSKIKRHFSVSKLETYEKNVLKNSVLFYDISIDDLKFWQENGFANGKYLPPIVEFPTANKSEKVATVTNKNPEYDVVFLGNLNAENNVASLIWFIQEVFPIIRSALPSIKVLIAGSNPVKKVTQICENQEGIDFQINPVSSSAIYNSGRVLINPVATGSGVSIKSIEMLITGRPIVSKPQGVAGLPEEVKQYFNIAVDAKDFAAEIIKLLSNPQTVNVEKELLESLFGYQVVERVVSDIKSLL
ncbi:MAG: glycosyltransferase [Heteroscytonema crispum UTEX LB 1556]